jgi:N-methylhydantoinase B
MQIQGKRVDGRPITSSMFSYSGGMGARASKAGPSATCYPTGIAAVPVEIIEAVTPVIFRRKELRANSGGDGAARGGDGQIIQVRLDTRDEWLLNTVTSRVEEGP